MWDIHRTFPAHEYFKSSGGEGQEMLYKISKVSTSSFISYVKKVRFQVRSQAAHTIKALSSSCSMKLVCINE